MTLLREIQAEAVDSSKDLADLLRKCKVLASRLNHHEFGAWVAHELNGYPDRESLPPYRIARVESRGHFSGPIGSELKNVPIPPTALPEEVRAHAEEQLFTEPIGSLAPLCSGPVEGSLKGLWPADLILLLNQQGGLMDRMVLMSAWRVLSPHVIKGILDTVRTRILDFALAIEQSDPTAGDAKPGEQPRVTPATVTAIYNTTILGGQAFVGVSGDATMNAGTSPLSAAIPESSHAEIIDLLRHLKDKADFADTSDRDEALSALAKVKEQLASPKPRIERIKPYLDLYATLVTVASPTVTALQRALALLG